MGYRNYVALSWSWPPLRVALRSHEKERNSVVRLLPATVRLTSAFRRKLSLAILSALFLALLPNVAVAQTYYNIIARHSELCWDVYAASQSPRAPIIQYYCGDVDQQQFRFVRTANGYYYIVARHSGQCLDVRRSSQANGAPIIQYYCGGTTNQQFLARHLGDGYWAFVARHSGKCLDIRGASLSPRARLQQWDCVWSENQQFDLIVAPS